MVVIGVLGLVCTACGVMFLPSSGIGLIGVIPGALMLWAAVKLWQEIGRAPSSPSKSDANDGPPAD